MKKIKGFLLLSITLLIIPLFSITARADAEDLWDSYDVPSSRQKELLVDKADLLTDDEEADLLQLLESVSQNRQCNIVVLTVDDYTGPIQDYADDYFDYNGFGADYNDSGILFMLCMGTREWAFSTSGEGIYAFTDYGQEELIDNILPYLSDGDYYRAFTTYAKMCDDYLGSYEDGAAIDVDNTYRSSGDNIKLILISLLCGFGAALIPIFFMGAQLKTVHSQANAAGYQSHQGLNMKSHEDRYVTTRVTHTPIPKDNDSRSHSSGGSSTHTSSSGHSHGGSHGHF
jgi:uncharacterized protein